MKLLATLLCCVCVDAVLGFAIIEFPSHTYSIKMRTPSYIGARVCDRNEEYTPVNALCQRMCEGTSNQCFEKSVEGCVCKPGFARDIEGNCVNATKCVNKCGFNEFYSSTRAACPRKCSAPDNKICNRILKAGCICLPGLMRTDDGKCVRPKDCPVRHYLNTKNCTNVEEYSPSGSMCQPTCGKPFAACRSFNAGGGCICKSGFRRNSKGYCVPVEECNPNSYNDRFYLAMK